MRDSFLSEGAVKSGIILLIYCRGYPALLYFVVIVLISVLKFDAIFSDIHKSLIYVS